MRYGEDEKRGGRRVRFPIPDERISLKADLHFLGSLLGHSSLSFFRVNVSRAGAFPRATEFAFLRLVSSWKSPRWIHTWFLAGGFLHKTPAAAVPATEVGTQRRAPRRSAGESTVDRDPSEASTVPLLEWPAEFTMQRTDSRHIFGDKRGAAGCWIARTRTRER